jgi:hypothetical protein
MAAEMSLPGRAVRSRRADPDIDGPAVRTAATADWDRPYALAADVRVIRRDSATVQVGLEPPRSVLVRHAPPEAVEVLRDLDGRVPLGSIVSAHRAARDLWLPLISGLIGVGLVVDAGESVVPPPHLLDVRAALAHRHGQHRADRMLRRRADAMVVVAGSAQVGTAVAEVLGASGVGEVHLKAGPGARGRRSRYVREGDPAPQVLPALVVLADENAGNRAMAAGLTLDLIPHLPVSVGVSRTVVGPLVLPGRSACLVCLDRIRSDLDPGHPSIAESGPALTARSAPVLVAMAVALAAEQALDHIDGHDRPSTVDATLEWASGAHSARRRSWFQHPDCGCLAITP